ncbi:MAG: dTDP-4-dehydrorhamnose reductase [Betaproteobacteria bacterium]|nr:MAG: dTDP-4-dehydrorhamnose reductase [Betaproteobacteria bacterium]
MPNKPLKVLICGANGQLGLALSRRLDRAHEVICLSRTQLDIGNENACNEALAAARADVVFNCAAYTAVDRAETEREAAFAINREGPRNLARASARTRSLLVHFSTDYVFDGVAPIHNGAPRAYVESDPTAPLGVYGASKLAGEIAVAEATERFAVFRLSWVYANDGANFYKTMLRLAGERDRLRVVNDQRGIPNFTGDLADAIASTLESGLEALAVNPGVYHLSATGEPASWHQFASEIIERAQLPAKPVVEAISTAEFPTPATRPAWSALDSSRFTATFGVLLPHWRDGLARCLGERRLSA